MRKDTANVKNEACKEREEERERLNDWMEEGRGPDGEGDGEDPRRGWGRDGKKGHHGSI